MSNYSITKEQIPFELMSKEEVLENPDAQKHRKNQLQKAANHNRLFYSKAKIVFQTMEGNKEVFANIWEVTDNHVMLKGGINIPVRCIHEVIVESGNRL